ncbi:MAG: hypothetical protein FWD45_00945 [Coriobacteriia bacterium]|nr:hypothetical protein [Coriobacteriia bacterium]
MTIQIEQTLNSLFTTIIDFFGQRDASLSETVAGEFFDYVEPRASLDNEEFDRLVGLFNEWFLFDYVLPSGLTPLMEYLRDNPENLSQEQLMILEEVGASHFSSDFWLMGVDSDAGLVLLEPFHEEVTFEVFDSRASVDMADLKGALALRLVRVQDQWYPASTGIYFYETNPSSDLREMIRNAVGVGPQPYIDLVKENFSTDDSVAIVGADEVSLRSDNTTPELVQMEYELVCSKAGVSVPWETIVQAIYESSADDNPYEMIKVIYSDGLPDKATFFTLFDILIKAWNVLPKRRDEA